MMEGLPRISVITITYNSAATLEETILSVTTQDYPALEYVIIDGGSTDATLDIVRKYQDRIAVCVSEPDKGISDAFNKGIRRATGEIIGIINSDDILMPGTLKSIAEHYRLEVDVYSGNVLFWNDKTGEMVCSKPDIVFDKLRLQYGVAHPSRFIRKDAYERFGYYAEQLRYNMDGELLCRFYQKGAVFIHVDENWTKFRMGGATADSIYKKKEDYRYTVKSYGGSDWDFRVLWFKAVVKYNLIQLGYKLFGENLRFKIGRIGWLKRLSDSLIKWFF